MAHKSSDVRLATREAYERDGYVVAEGVLPLATTAAWKELVKKECVVSACSCCHGFGAFVASLWQVVSPCMCVLDRVHLSTMFCSVKDTTM